MEQFEFILFFLLQTGSTRKGEVSPTKGREVQKDPMECVRLEINLEWHVGVWQIVNQSVCTCDPSHWLHPFQLKKED